MEVQFRSTNQMMVGIIVNGVHKRKTPEQITPEVNEYINNVRANQTEVFGRPLLDNVTVDDVRCAMVFVRKNK